MSQQEPESIAKDLMPGFAARTGLGDGGEAPRRYLWTDAFALCNFLELYRRSGEDRYLRLALRLTKQVHEVLGRHRADDGRSGWISDPGEEEGRLHPTAGGLRIGKKLGERGIFRGEDAMISRRRLGRTRVEVSRIGQDPQVLPVAWGAWAKGRLTVKVVPRLTSLSTEILPWCFCTML